MEYESNSFFNLLLDLEVRFKKIKKNKLSVELGKTIFQEKFINKSYRYRGNVARIQTKKKINNITVMKYFSSLM